MKFGLFYELSVPRPWTRESERTVYKNALEQVRLADELGFDQVWAVEHHFLEEYSHCPAPELFLTACAMLTKKIRVGPRHRRLRAGVQPPDQDRRAHRRARHPLRRPPRGRHRPLGHLDGARRLPRQPRHHQEVLGRVRALPAEDVDAGDASPTRASSGRCRSGRSCPRSYQRPHPPMWVAVTIARHRARRRRPRPGQPRAHLRRLRRAGEADRRVPAAHPALRAGGRVRQRPGQHGELPLLPRGRRDRPRHRPAHGRHVQLPRLAAHLGARGVSRAAPTRRSASCRSSAVRPPGPTPASRRARGSPSAAPSACCDALKRWEAVGVDRVNFLLNADGGHPAGRRAGEPAAVRQGGHAGVRDDKPANGAPRREAPDADLRHARADARSSHRLPDDARPRHRGVDRCPAPRSSSSRSRCRARPSRCCRARCTRRSRRTRRSWSRAIRESPVGPFTLAQLRLMGRAGAHPRGFVLGAVASTPEAADRAPRALGTAGGAG